MRIIDQSVEVLTPINEDDILSRIEMYGRVCYQSESNIKEGSAKKFVQSLINRGHESVLEHISITMRIITDRGVSHELVRHRIASFSQESTRYVDYKSEMEFIKPIGLTDQQYWDWRNTCERAELSYKWLRNDGATPEIARSVLPNSLKTELIMTANLREWRHILKLRSHKSAHPQIRDLADMILFILKATIPTVVSDL